MGLMGQWVRLVDSASDQFHRLTDSLIYTVRHKTAAFYFCNNFVKYFYTELENVAIANALQL